MQALVNTANDENPVALKDVEEPQPSGKQVLVEVRAFSLNRGELTLLAKRTAGWRPGQDVAGVVVKAAANGPKLGDRVVGRVDGAGWSQRVAIDLENVAALPDSVTFERAATLPVAGLTALRMLRRGGMLLGKRVLITGGSGAVGSFAVQLAVAAGAQPTAVVHKLERKDAILKLGAENVVQDPEQANGSFALVLESVGGKIFESALGKLSPGGTIVVFGNSSGQGSQFSFYQFAEHMGAGIESFFSFLPDPSNSVANDLQILTGLIAAGKLKPPVEQVLSWRDFRHGHRALAEHKVHGKVVFTVDR